MYIPKLFREADQAALHDLMRANSFATLISQHDGAPYASHLPMLLQADAGPHGTLVGHMARANPQWREFDPGQEVLTIFQGPHAYVSPSWYETELSVPTWNYAVVHAYGTPRVIEDRAALYDILKAVVQMYEAPFEQPWPFALPADFVDKMMRAIVGFSIPITRLEGKYKLSQNRPLEDQQRVVEALHEQGDELSTGTAALMRPRVAASPVSPT
ncbi:MAG: FMN-binding negative transcriptional regulator [Candidatus Tectomicrobia bacterium]|nr:FMN-binding negative transcriptional regulator [Candidatus Tectomicrobia bacterium]